MDKPKRRRRIKSVADELVYKSREAALAAVQIFNNPQINFKSEIFIVIIIIAWTYLLHAYFRKNKIEYRYYNQKGQRKYFARTKAGAYKHWELERCLNDPKSPIDKDTANNLRFFDRPIYWIVPKLSIAKYIDGVSGSCLRFSRGTEGSVKGLILDGSIISLSHPLLGQHQGQR